MIRKSFAVVLTLVFLSGCWDYKDLDRLSIVTGMAFDRGEGGTVNVTLQVTDNSVSDENAAIGTRTLTASGKTVEFAVREAKKQLEHEIYYGNMVIAVFGRSFPVEEAVTWLKGVRGIRETLYLAVSEEAVFLDEGFAAFRMRDILDASETVKPVELYRFKDRLPLFRMAEDNLPKLTGNVPVYGS